MEDIVIRGVGERGLLMVAERVVRVVEGGEEGLHMLPIGRVDSLRERDEIKRGRGGGRGKGMEGVE